MLLQITGVIETFIYNRMDLKKRVFHVKYTHKNTPTQSIHFHLGKWIQQ